MNESNIPDTDHAQVPRRRPGMSSGEIVEIQEFFGKVVDAAIAELARENAEQRKCAQENSVLPKLGHPFDPFLLKYRDEKCKFDVRVHTDPHNPSVYLSGDIPPSLADVHIEVEIESDPNGIVKMSCTPTGKDGMSPLEMALREKVPSLFSPWMYNRITRDDCHPCIKLMCRYDVEVYVRHDQSGYPDMVIMTGTVRHYDCTRHDARVRVMMTNDARVRDMMTNTESHYDWGTYMAMYCTDPDIVYSGQIAEQWMLSNPQDMQDMQAETVYRVLSGHPEFRETCTRIVGG